MRFDPAICEVISGADARLRSKIAVGQYLTMPDPGIWMSLGRKYVIDHYAVHDVNVLIEFAFDPEMVLAGNLTDRETEFAAPSARVISLSILEE